MSMKTICAAAIAALLLGGAAPPSPLTTPTRVNAIESDPRISRAEETLGALSQALENRDAGAFLSLFHEDAVYALHHEGFAPAKGLDEIREAFAQLMAAFPDVRFETLGAQVKPGLAVSYWRMTGTLSALWPLGNGIATPGNSERPVSVEGVDIFTFTDDGRILRKDAFVDVGPWFEAYGEKARQPEPANILPSSGPDTLD